jgi:hypothetical protein
MGLFYKRIKHFRFQINRPKLVFDVVREMVTVRDMLKKNILSTTIFPILRWNSIEDETKRQIFSDHRDYNLINDFYKDLKQRDSDFSQKDISDQTLRKNNEDCLTLADYTLRNICWSKYHTVRHKKFHIIISIVTTISGVLLIFFIFEVLRIIFFVQFQSMIGPFYNIYYIFTLVSRGLVSFFVAREIIIYQSSYTYDISANNDMIHYTSLSATRHGLIKLFALSFLIMGIPMYLLGVQLNYVGRSDVAYQYFIAILIIDVIRMLILSFIIPKFIFKNTLYIK